MKYRLGLVVMVYLIMMKRHSIIFYIHTKSHVAKKYNRRFRRGKYECMLAYFKYVRMYRYRNQDKIIKKEEKTRKKQVQL